MYLMIAAFSSIGLPAYGDADLARPWEGVFRIGAASKVGTFYQAAARLCDVVNKNDTTYCVPVVTNGSLHNINLLRAGKLDLAVVKSDIALSLSDNQHRAAQAKDGIKVVAKLHDMPLTIIGRKEMGAYLTVDALDGYTINVGLEGSGERTASEELLHAMQLQMDQLETTRFDSRSVVRRFCDGETDIIIQLIAHPARIYDRLINECDGVFLSVPEPLRREVASINPYIFPSVIYGGFYSQDSSVYETYAVSALLISNQSLDIKLRKFIGQSVEQHLAELQQQLPEWIDMEPQDLMVDSPPEFILQ